MVEVSIFARFAKKTAASVPESTCDLRWALAAAIRTQELAPVEKRDGRQHSFLAAVARLTKLSCSHVDGFQCNALRFANGFELRLDFVGQVIENGRFSEITGESPFGRTSCHVLTIWAPQYHFDVSKPGHNRGGISLLFWSAQRPASAFYKNVMFCCRWLKRDRRRRNR